MGLFSLIYIKLNYHQRHGVRFNINGMYRDRQYKYKTMARPSYLYNGNYHIDKTAYLDKVNSLRPSDAYMRQ